MTVNLCFISSLKFHVFIQRWPISKEASSHEPFFIKSKLTEKMFEMKTSFLSVREKKQQLEDENQFSFQ